MSAGVKPYTHQVVAARGGVVFTGSIDACEQYMLDGGGDSFGWTIQPMQETVARWGSDELVTIRPASVLWRD